MVFLQIIYEILVPAPHLQNAISSPSRSTGFTGIHRLPMMVAKLMIILVLVLRLNQ